MPAASQQRIGSALAPAHDANLFGINGRQALHILGGGNRIANGALKRIALVICSGFAIAHKINTDGSNAVFLRQNRRGGGVAVAGFVTAGAGAVQHNNRRVTAFGCRHTNGSGNLMVTGVDADNRFGVCGRSFCQGTAQRGQTKRESQ
ncbi:hypothetical protein SDC9_185334 [bioreactor metagenome]|uniref:Uncharacterized protein n=1 Tax=bioreactor metagenome TaxID=1076179 RepID=A0A645HR31_9ZZZZ